MRDRVVIIGLDGATWTVLEPFIESGDLPNIAAMRRLGCWGDLRSTIPPLSAPAWSTFLTGKSPARHGVFHFVDWGDASGETAGSPSGLVDGRSIESPTLWDVAAHSDRRVGVINVPMSYPPRPVNGFMITCLLTPPGAEVFTFPPELSAELPDYQIDLDRFISEKPFSADVDGGQATKRVVRPDLELMEEFHRMEDQRGRTALSLMESHDWDLFTVVFTATDRMGHYLWPYHRAADLDGSAESAVLHEAIRAFYRRIDEMIGELRDAAGDDATVIIMSDHGMGPIYHKIAQWNSWLHRQGYVKLTGSSTRTIDGWLLKLGIPRDRIRNVMAKIPGLTSSKPVRSLTAARTAEIDKNASIAYFDRWFDPVGGIRINAKGAERDRIRAELMESIAGLVDEETGTPIVRELLTPEECLTGPYIDRAPDIILHMHPEYGSSNRVSNYSSIVTRRPRIGDPGGHHMEGILICAGEGIATRADSCEDLDIEDIAPTVLHALGVPVPSDMDGRVLTELFERGGRFDRPIETAGPMEWWPDEASARATTTDHDADDEAAVRDRLRALGYFE